MKQTFNNTIFSKKLRQKRIIDENIDMRKLADILGISASTISRCENGKMPDLLTYATLCKWMNAPMQEFIKNKKTK